MDPPKELLGAKRLLTQGLGDEVREGLEGQAGEIEIVFSKNCSISNVLGTCVSVFNFNSLMCKFNIFTRA